MKFSTKTRYAIRTMLEIASDNSGSGVLQKDIASKQDLSVKYLDHIIAALKAAGLIQNLKGKKSGYVLSRPAAQISMFDIHNAFENGICVIECIDLNSLCKKTGKCKSQTFWKGLNEIVLEHFKNTSLLDIMNSEA
ncbi:MAG: Rrf2 family transcriptional regulator [Prolixibacteraceae bacterium]|nr:Rrf2 family transcriptional regulator [Prolixibacteraceae bacterium]